MNCKKLKDDLISEDKKNAKNFGSRRDEDARGVHDDRDMIKARKAELKDLEDVFRWRNDETTRKMSLSTDKIAWEAHNAWFQENLQNASKLLLICEDIAAKDKIAFTRFDLEEDWATISVNLSPSKRGQGFAKPCLERAVAFLAQARPEIKRARAQIKSVNKPSLRAFKSVGFALIAEKNGVADFEYMI